MRPAAPSQPGLHTKAPTKRANRRSGMVSTAGQNFESVAPSSPIMFSVGFVVDNGVVSYEIGNPATGTVVRVVQFGLFLELEDGTQGFVDGAAMSDPPLPIPAEDTWPKVGDVITGRVVYKNDHQTRLSLSLGPPM